MQGTIYSTNERRYCEQLFEGKKLKRCSRKPERCIFFDTKLSLSVSNISFSDNINLDFKIKSSQTSLSLINRKTKLSQIKIESLYSPTSLSLTRLDCLKTPRYPSIQDIEGTISINISGWDSQINSTNLLYSRCHYIRYIEVQLYRFVN